MSRPRMAFVAFLVSLAAVVLPAVAAQAAPDKPSRVVIIVLDQARPDTITRYGMTNVQQLQRDGKSFKNAIVGDMAAETVVSHNVITSGLFPGHMGWSNEIFRDENGQLGPPGPQGHRVAGVRQHLGQCCSPRTGSHHRRLDHGSTLAVMGWQDGKP